jgi:DNA-directed RNA polymerase specialized sigma24 family protein
VGHADANASTAPRALQARLAQLPARQFAGLRAALAGFDDEEIAVLLAVPVESVRPTLRLAAAKLEAVLR